MKSIPWIPVAISVFPLSLAGFLAFTDLKSDVRLLDAAWAAGEKNYQSLDTKVESIRRDLRSQGTSQAVTASQIRKIQDELQKLEKSSSESSRRQAELLRQILNRLSQ